MAPTLSECRKRIDEILSDGEWHNQDEVVRDAMRLVPPGPAFRHAEASRTRWNPGPRTKGVHSDSIATGQRLIAMQTVYSAVRRNRFERKWMDGGEHLRDMKVVRSHPSNLDVLVGELNEQLLYWERTYRMLPAGDVRDSILGGDPVASIKATLDRVGRSDEVQSG